MYPDVAKDFENLAVLTQHHTNSKEMLRDSKFPKKVREKVLVSLVKGMTPQQACFVTGFQPRRVMAILNRPEKTEMADVIESNVFSGTNLKKHEVMLYQEFSNW